MTLEQTLTDQERLANLSLDQLRELVGLVDYDASQDPFPITGWDALVWTVGNATQAAAYYQLVYGMKLVAYAGPATGLRDHHSFVLESGAARFVLNGPVEPDSELVQRLARHGDGISDIALEVPTSTGASPTRGRSVPKFSTNPTTSATSTARCGWPPSRPTATPDTP